MHGLGGSGAQFAGQSEWARFADANAFIVVFPTGPRKWDFRDGSTDVDFIRAVVAEVRAEQCIDGKRIWATGHSMGGFMTQRLACDAGDLFAAGASTAGGNVTAPVIGGDCRAGADAAPDSGYEPVPLGFWHGTADQVVRYDGGRTTLAGWVARYGCGPVAHDDTAPYGPVEEFGDCTRADVVAREAATERPFVIRFHTYVDHRHGYPDGCGGLGAASAESCEPDASAWPTVDFHNTEILEFLAAHPRHRAAP
jgi:polyhydroxybutyrate depolymerase